RHRPSRRRARLRDRPPTLGRRARVRAAAQLPTAARALRTRPPDPRGVPLAGLRDPVLQKAPVILKDLLSTAPLGWVEVGGFGRQRSAAGRACSLPAGQERL